MSGDDSAAVFAPDAGRLGEMSEKLIDVLFPIATVRDIASGHVNGLDEHPSEYAARQERLAATLAGTGRADKMAVAALSLSPVETIEKFGPFIEATYREIAEPMEAFEGYLTIVCDMAGLASVAAGHLQAGHAHRLAVMLTKATAEALQVKGGWQNISAALRRIPMFDIFATGNRIKKELVFAQMIDGKSQPESMTKAKAMAMFRVKSFRVLRDNNQAVDDPTNIRKCFVFSRPPEAK